MPAQLLAWLLLVDLLVGRSLPRRQGRALLHDALTNLGGAERPPYRNKMDAPALMDGDDAFTKVDTRRPAHELEPGVAADAVNKRFEDGRAWPRHNVNCGPWGKPENLAAGVTMTGFDDQHVSGEITGLVIGQTYYYKQGRASEEYLTDYEGNNRLDESGSFVAVTTTYVLWATSDSSVVVTAEIYRLANPCGFARFNDPSGVDNLVLVTDDWRDAGSEDGGRGRAWRILSGQIPIEIPLNGHDIWGTARLIPCHNGLVLLRHGNERHYFQASAVNATTNRIQLNCTPAWASGELVLYVPDLAASSSILGGAAIAITDSVAATGVLTSVAHGFTTGQAGTIAGIAGITDGLVYIHRIDADTYTVHATYAQAVANTSPLLPNSNGDTGTISLSGPGANTLYYVKNISGNKVELYTDSALTSIIDLGTAYGRFYLERQAQQPGFYGNGAPPLLMQPTAAGLTAFESGFKAVSATVTVTDTDATNDIITADNHRLIPGDAFTATGVTGLTGGTTYYAKPLNDHQLKAYSTLANALAGGATGLMNLTADDETGTLTKLSASGLPMPPAREGVYTANNRLILVNGKNNISISDPLDPLHFTPYSAAFSANLGEADEVKAVIPFGEDVILFIKEHVVLGLFNFSAGVASWALKEVTREYGGLAPLSPALVGVDAWFLSRRGVASIAQTIQGKLQGVAIPVSWPMKKHIDRIDWKNAGQSVSMLWNNRFFIAVPLKGQTGTIKNNGVLVWNTVNQGWEGLWQGDELEVYAFAKHNVFGDERLCFVDYSGNVKWFGDGWTDLGAAIADSLTTRIYTGRNAARRMGRKNWLSGQVIWDTFKPTLSIRAQAPGYNEYSDVLVDKAYDPTKYLVYGQEDYDPTTATVTAGEAQDRPGDIIPSPGGYDITGTADYTGLTVGQSYLWTPGENETSITNGTDTLTAAGAIVALTESMRVTSNLGGEGEMTCVLREGLPSSGFDEPHREDYSATVDELLIAKTDIHQNITEGFRMRLDDWGVQLIISNTNGSARVQSVEVQGVEMARASSRTV